MTEKTLRDEFAMAALGGLVNDPTCHDAAHEIVAENSDETISGVFAVLAYSIADAMLAVREKTAKTGEQQPSGTYTAVSNFTVPGGNNDQ